jgi:hypothetical protein
MHAGTKIQLSGCIICVIIVAYTFIEPNICVHNETCTIAEIVNL